MEKWKLIGTIALVILALISKTASYYIGIFFFVLLGWYALKHFSDCHGR